MSKETKKASNKYQITLPTLLEGYFAKIDGKDFIIVKGESKLGVDKKGKQTRTLQPGSVFENERTTDKDYFTDLSDMQIHELYVAGVIKLDGTQQTAYDKFIKEYYK